MGIPRAQPEDQRKANTSGTPTSALSLDEPPSEQRPNLRPSSPPRPTAASRSPSSSRLPVWAARAVFLLGLLNIASAILRRSPRLMDWSQDYLPPFGAVASVAVIGIGVGCGLLAMARGLRRRKHRAWIATVVLLSAAILVHLVRGTELIQASVSAAVVAMLLAAHRQFVGRPDPRSRQAAPLSLLAIMVASWLLGVIAIVADQRELTEPWSGTDVAEHSILGLLGIAGPLRFDSADAAAESSYLLLGLGILTGLTALMVLLHNSGPTVSAADRTRIRALLDRHGHVDSLGYFATRCEKSYIFSASGKAARPIASRRVSAWPLATRLGMSKHGQVRSRPGHSSPSSEPGSQRCWPPPRPVPRRTIAPASMRWRLAMRR